MVEIVYARLIVGAIIDAFICNVYMTTFEKEKKQFMENTLSIFMLTISFFVISLNFEGGGITLIIRKMIIASILIIMFMNALSDIHFKMINEQEQLTVSIKNPIIEEVEVVEGNYIKTTKQDKENHGIGMKNIKFIIEKYQGASTIKCKDKWFNFSAILPHKQEKLKI